MSTPDTTHGSLDQLLGAAADEAGATAPTDPAVIQDIALTWVASRWLDDRHTRAAVRTPARLGETNLDLNLGHFPTWVTIMDSWRDRPADLRVRGFW